MESKSKTKNVVIFLVLLSIVLIAVIVVAFTMFFKEQERNVKEIVKTGTVSMNYKSEVNGLQLTSITPVANDVAIENRAEGSYFDFSVSSDYLEKQTSGTYSKVDNPKQFTPVKKKTNLGSPAKSMVLGKFSLSTNQVDNYRLRIWVKDGAVITDPSANYKVRVNVYGKAK